MNEDYVASEESAEQSGKSVKGVLLAALHRYLPHDVTWDTAKPDEALVWLTLPSTVNTHDLLRWAERHGVALAVSKAERSAMYPALGLSYAELEAESAEHVVRRLAYMINRYRHLAERASGAMVSHVGP